MQLITPQIPAAGKTFAAAQTIPLDGDIAGNIQDHLQWCRLAAAHGAELIIFPELSLTGYQREGAAALALHPDDPRLASLRNCARLHRINIIAGAPIRLGGALYIGALLFLADGSCSLYTKQFLHEGEEQFFQAGRMHNPLLQLGAQIIACAVCADIDHPQHARQASQAQANFYAAGIFFTPNGVPEAYRLLETYAKKHAMCVLMANYAGQSWHLPAGGRSAFWDADGRLIGKLEPTGKALLTAKRQVETWTVQILTMT